jgi:hypothetical protein
VAGTVGVGSFSSEDFEQTPFDGQGLASQGDGQDVEGEVGEKACPALWGKGLVTKEEFADSEEG